jgi:hypothetical protein
VGPKTLLNCAQRLLAICTYLKNSANPTSELIRLVCVVSSKPSLYERTCTFLV